MTTGSRSPTPDEFQDQLDALEELESIESRLRWVPQGAIERFLLGLRRRQLSIQVASWNRRFAEDLDEHELHQERIRRTG